MVICSSRVDPQARAPLQNIGRAVARRSAFLWDIRIAATLRFQPDGAVMRVFAEAASRKALRSGDIVPCKNMLSV